MSRSARWFLLAVLTLAAWTLAAPAWAGSADSIDSMTADFTVSQAGPVHVTESVVYRFGTASGRHGITWTLLTREPYDDASDAVYTISNIAVSSPNASAAVQTSTRRSGRNQWLTLRIGSPDRTVATPTASYTISYDVSGALRHFSGYDEFYWDVVSEDTPAISNLGITVHVPGGVRDVSCFNGPVKSTQHCTDATVSGGVGHYTVASKLPGDVVSIGAKIGSGLVADPRPHLVTRADHTARQLASLARVAGPIAAVVPPILGVIAWRRRRDERYVGLPPGVVPAAGQASAVGPSTRMEIPVAFAPPRLTVAEAGLLEDGRFGSPELAGTLVDLAVRGVVTLGGDESTATVRLRRSDLPLAPHEDALLGAVFGGPGSRSLSDAGVELGRTADLSTAGQIYRAEARMRRLVLESAREGRWYKRLPGLSAGNLGAPGCLLLLVVGMAVAVGWSAMSSGAGLTGVLSPTLVVWVIVVLLSAAATVVVVHARSIRGQRSADGTALTDQIRGFRTYLATAEAEQLRFEEGEDIYSKYLPWAIIFGLTERWAKVCQRLVELGRLPDTPPTWYAGPAWMWSPYWITGQVGHITTAAMPPVAVSSGSSGFGGGSSFGGGGFSGGGGGGTSIGSW